MKHFSAYIFACFFSSILVACGSGGGGDNPNFTVFDGTWDGGCGLSDFGESETKVRFIDGEYSRVTINYYSTSDCSDTPNFTLIGESVITYGDIVPSASSVCSNAQEINYSEQSVTSSALGVFELDDEFYDLICVSSDRTLLYFGDPESGEGTSEDTRPTLIDDENFHTKI